MQVPGLASVLACRRSRSRRNARPDFGADRHRRKEKRKIQSPPLRTVSPNDERACLRPSAANVPSHATVAKIPNGGVWPHTPTHPSSPLSAFLLSYFFSSPCALYAWRPRLSHPLGTALTSHPAIPFTAWKPPDLGCSKPATCEPAQNPPCGRSMAASRHEQRHRSQRIASRGAWAATGILSRSPPPYSQQPVSQFW